MTRRVAMMLVVGFAAAIVIVLIQSSSNRPANQHQGIIREPQSWKVVIDDNPASIAYLDYLDNENDPTLRNNLRQALKEHFGSNGIKDGDCVHMVLGNKYDHVISYPSMDIDTDPAN